MCPWQNVGSAVVGCSGLSHWSIRSGPSALLHGTSPPCRAFLLAEQASLGERRLASLCGWVPLLFDLGRTLLPTLRALDASLGVKCPGDVLLPPAAACGRPHTGAGLSGRRFVLRPCPALRLPLRCVHTARGRFKECLF